MDPPWLLVHQVSKLTCSRDPYVPTTYRTRSHNRFTLPVCSYPGWVVGRDDRDTIRGTPLIIDDGSLLTSSKSAFSLHARDSDRRHLWYLSECRRSCSHDAKRRRLPADQMLTSYVSVSPPLSQSESVASIHRSKVELVFAFPCSPSQRKPFELESEGVDEIQSWSPIRQDDNQKD